MRIEYGVDVIVAVVHRSFFRWYVTEKELWFLDGKKWRGAFLAAGHEVPGDDVAERFGIEVLDSSNAGDFLERIDDQHVTVSDLCAVLAAKVDGGDFPEMVPALLVDFDARRLVSMFPEPSSFEDFVPDDWRGVHADFLDEVPPGQRFWLVDGRDVFGAQEEG